MSLCPPRSDYEKPGALKWFQSNLPGPTLTHSVPVEFLDVHKDPHQLGDGHGWVSVVQLDGDLEDMKSCSETAVAFVLTSHKQGRLLYEMKVCYFAALLEVVSISTPLLLVFIDK